jgi:ribose transport system substrate-binding protein
MSRAFVWSIIAGASLLLTGCSSSETKAKYKIAVIPKGLTHEFWQSIHRGAERAAADLTAKGTSVMIEWDGPRTENQAKEQDELVDRMTRMGINGLVLAPQDKKSMVDPVRRAVKKNIPCVIIDSGLDEEELKKEPDLIVKYVATNNYNGGKMAAEKLLKQLAADGKTEPRVAMLRYQPGSESTEQRERGFLDGLKEAENKGVKLKLISDDKYAGATVDTAEKEATPWVETLRDEKIDGIFAVNESATHGLLNALRAKKMVGAEARNKGRQVCFVGFDSSETLLQAVREGDIAGLVVQDPYYMGYIAVWTIVRHLEGDNVAGTDKYFGTGEVYLTKDNVDSDEMKGHYDADAQAKRTIPPPEFGKK